MFGLTKKKPVEAAAGTETLQFSGTVEIQAKGEGEAKRPTISILAYSGGIISVGGWGKVALDLSGLELPKQVPLLADHDSNLSGIVGYGVPRVGKGKLAVSGQLSEATAAAKTVLALARDGFAFQSSVGVEPTKRKYIAPGETVQVNGQTLESPQGDGFILVEAGKLREVSITAVAADDSTSVAIAASLNKERNTMPTDLENALVAERNRIKTIDAMLRPPSGGWQGADDAVAEIRAKAIDGEISLADLPARVGQVAELAARRSSFPSHANGPIHTPQSIGGNVEAKSVVSAALLCRMGRATLAEKTHGEHVLEASRSLQSASLVDLARASLQADGKQIPTNRNDLLRASLGFSNATLSEAISDTMHTILQEQYAEQNQSWRSFASIKMAEDFREHNALQVNVGDQLEEIGKDGEIKHATISDTTYTFAVKQFAKQLRLTRVDLVNDNVGAIEEVPMIFARMALRKIADLVYTTLLGAGSHYSSGNGNLLEAGSDLDVTSLAAAIVAMMTQRDADNNDLDIMPRVLLVPPELRTTAQGVLESEFLERAVSQSASVDNLPTGNPLRKTVKLEVESRLSNTAKFANASTAGWYLMAGSLDLPLIVAFLNGQQTPIVDFFGMDSDPNTLGVSWRVIQDVGAALGDPKASVRATGAS